MSELRKARTLISLLSFISTAGSTVFFLLAVFQLFHAMTADKGTAAAASLVILGVYLSASFVCWVFFRAAAMGLRILVRIDGKK